MSQVRSFEEKFALLLQTWRKRPKKVVALPFSRNSSPSDIFYSRVHTIYFFILYYEAGTFFSTLETIALGKKFLSFFSFLLLVSFLYLVCLQWIISTRGIKWKKKGAQTFLLVSFKNSWPTVRWIFAVSQRNKQKKKRKNHCGDFFFFWSF